MSPPDDASSSEYGFGPTRPRVVVFVSSPLFAVTIDKGAKYKFSGASATQNSKEHAIQGLTTSLLHPMSNNVTNNYSTSVRIGDLSPWRHLTACSPCHEVGTTPIHGPSTLDQRRADFAMCNSQKNTFVHGRPLGGRQPPCLKCSDNGLRASPDRHILLVRQE